jgi:hypothetical protein
MGNRDTFTIIDTDNHLYGHQPRELIRCGQMSVPGGGIVAFGEFQDMSQNWKGRRSQSQCFRDCVKDSVFKDFGRSLFSHRKICAANKSGFLD